MIDYATFCQIHLLHEQKGLKAAQIAEELKLNPKTVEKWTLALTEIDPPALTRSDPPAEIEGFLFQEGRRLKRSNRFYRFKTR